MVVHIVMFTFKEENKAANVAKAKAMLEALTEKIDPLLSMEVGVDFNGSERAMDLVLTTTFETEEGLATYATHPAHLEVVAFIKDVTEMSKVVDYVR
ncbi:Dabb family protein [Sulfurimonas diazotrophicus]|uniref:Dabb family protein n=1 Tax=Sulfurimonas diazotrophicus TaxID=3131939 RepID=A0ABZ3HCG3_9BACT